MDKKKLNTMKRALSEMVEQVGSASAEIYQRKRSYVQEYITQGKVHFTHKWHDDFLEQDCELAYPIAEVIHDLHNELCLPLEHFLKAPDEALFRAILSKAYYLTAAYVRLHLSGEDQPELFNPSDSCFAFLASFFFGQEEQKHSFFAFQNLLAKPSDCACPQEMDAAHTLFPLSFFLAKEYLSLEADISQASSFTFNDLYRTACAGFTEENKDKAQQIFADLCDYHLKQCRSSNKAFPEFEHPIEQWMPWEILALLRLRALKGLDNSFIDHPLISPFIPFVGLEPQGFFDDEQKLLRRAMLQEFS
ncbi:hypothetical protein CO608_08865 [Lysobacteraceae bacterium NML08-0793]|nr:hypothetical protein CO608_08865 [Xanthomonadaceae bacterium NML08-0793]